MAKAFNVLLILEFSGATTGIPIVAWIENVELVSEFCAMEKIERIQPLWLWGSALATYRQPSKEQRTDTEQIKRALITAYATDRFKAFNQFVAQCLCPEETVDEFSADMHYLARLVREPLLDW